MGAEDYITKPFSTREVMARVRNALRHAEHDPSARRLGSRSSLSAGGFSIDRAGRVARCDRRVLDLTRTEFDILLMLVRKPGRVLSRQELAEALHGSSKPSNIRVVDTHVKNLRNAIGSPAKDRIVAVYGVGYKLDV